MVLYCMMLFFVLEEHSVYLRENMSKRKNPEWSKIESSAAKKRSGKDFVRPKTGNSSKISTILTKQELVVQRLSAELNGKTPKYAPIGPREFVPYLDEDLTIPGIKAACWRHFSNIDDLVKLTECDVLASERGPSCKNVDQIPNVSLIHVRFITKAGGLSLSYKDMCNKPHNSIHSSFKIPFQCYSKSTSLPSLQLKKRNNVEQNRIAPSLSLSKMLKIGRAINDTREIFEIDVKNFDIETMHWTDVDTIPIRFSVNKEILGHGAFRDVYEASSTHPLFKGKWVVKRYNNTAAIAIVDDLNQSLEQHTRKAVQMTCLAGNFVAKLREIGPEVPQFKYVKIYFGAIKEKEEFCTIEEMIEGGFEKYLNNDGMCSNGHEVDEMKEKAECLAHFSFQQSKESLLLTDIQGYNNILTDPEIASSEISKDQEVLFCVGNYCRKAIKNFGMTHVCNRFCRLSDLSPLNNEDFSNYDDTIDFPIL